MNKEYVERLIGVIEGFLESLDEVPKEYQKRGVTKSQWTEMMVTAYRPMMKEWIYLIKGGDMKGGQ